MSVKKRQGKAQESQQPVTNLEAPEDVAYQAEQERQREEVYAASENLTWRGAALLEWSEGRQRLFDHLNALDLPLPEDVTDLPADQFVNLMFGRSVKMLYLLHHEPEHFRHLRPRLLSVIEEWGEQHVPADTPDDKVAAVKFMIDVLSAHRKLQALVRPGKASRKDSSGN